MSFRLDPEWREWIDEWRSEEPGNPSFSQAIRDVILFGLSASQKERKQAGRKQG